MMIAHVFAVRAKSMIDRQPNRSRWHWVQLITGRWRLLSAAAGLGLALSPMTSIGAPFRQLHEFTPDVDGSGVKRFRLGKSVGMDGNLVAAGTGREESGAVHLFDIESLEELRVLTAPDTDRHDEFGAAVAVSGDVVAVGAPGKTDFAASRGIGAVYLFNASTGEQIRRIMAETGVAFGHAVALEGNRLLIGSPDEPVGDATFAGAAYLYDATTGEQLARFTASDAAEEGAFGSAVAFDGDIAVIGSTSESDDFEPGSAYLFNLATAAEIAKLSHASLEDGDLFGLTVGVGGGMVLVGAPGKTVNDVFAAGAVFVFDPGGNFLRRFSAAQLEETASFGSSIAMDGTRAVIGSSNASVDGVYGAGAAYVMNPSTGEQFFRLTAADPGILHRLGASAAISGAIAAFGAPGDDDFGRTSGSVYMFNIETGARLAKAPEPGQQFGFSIAVEGEIAVAGAPVANGTGTAAVMNIETGATLRQLAATGLSDGSRFGHAVAMHGGLAAIGAPFDSGAGSAFLFDTQSGNQLAELGAVQMNAGDAFGYAVALGPNLVAVGAPGADRSGVVFLFDRAGQSQRELRPTDAVEGARFGAAVVIQSGAVIVGAPSDGAEVERSGAVYVFDASSGEQLSRLVPEQPRPNGRFGFSIAASADLLGVGAPPDPDLSSESGSVHWFDLETLQFVRQFTEHEDGFGHSVAIDGEIAAVGAPLDSAGVVLLFNVRTLRPIAEMEADRDAPGQQFGAAVAISGTRLLGGAPADRNGAVFVFDIDRDGGIKLLADDFGPAEEFGFSVAVQGENILVGARRDGFRKGAVYLFHAATAGQVVKLTGADSKRDDHLGYSVAIDGNLALAGAPGHGDSGAAYLFDLTTGEQLAKFTAPEADQGADFGSSVALSGSRAFIGAPRDGAAGAVYVFDTEARQQTGRLIPSDADANARFGRSIAVDGDRAVVGATLEGADGAGAAYVFSVGDQTELFKLTAPAGEPPNRFGRSVALHSGLILVGANKDPFTPGGAHLFDANSGAHVRSFRAPVAGFGWSVDLDQAMVLVGAPGFSESSILAFTGTAFLFDSKTGEELRRVQPFQSGPQLEFGHAVAIDNGVAVIGAPGLRRDPGEAYLFRLLEDSRPELTISQTTAGFVIEWTGSAELQSAREITGPWTDLPQASSPFVIEPVGPQGFFRLKELP